MENTYILNIFLRISEMAKTKANNSILLKYENSRLDLHFFAWMKRKKVFCVSVVHIFGYAYFSSSVTCGS